MPRAGNIFQLLSQVDLGVVLADPSCIEAVVRQKVLINRNSVLFWVRTCRDRCTQAVALLVP